MPDEDGFRKFSLGLWEELIRGLFPEGIPTSAQWTELKAMSSVLNFIGSKENANHMFYPTGGGMDLEGAVRFDEEPGCLALKTGDRVAEVVKPSALLFESFGAELGWAYFRLECAPMSPCGVYDYGEDGDDNLPLPKREEVVLVEPGTYGTRSDWDANSSHGKRLPETAQLIIRSLGGGPFVVFSKGSTYNFARGKGFDAYSAPHATNNAQEFRQFIANAARR